MSNTVPTSAQPELDEVMDSVLDALQGVAEAHARGFDEGLEAAARHIEGHVGALWETGREAQTQPYAQRVVTAGELAAELRAKKVKLGGTLNTPQPAPVTTDAGPEVWPALLAEVALSPELRALCEERDAMGRAKYGTALRVHNGREPLVDALQEALDLAVYLQQAWMRSRDARLWWARNSALELAQEILDEVKP